MKKDQIVIRLSEDIDQAEAKAWDALGRYKFQMFGYWAAIWVHLNRIEGDKRPNPWKRLVATAKQESDRRTELGNDLRVAAWEP